MGRRLEERQLHTDGSPLTAWDDCPTPPAGWELPGWGSTESDWRTFVANLNKSMKLQGSTLRFRVVEDES